MTLPADCNFDCTEIFMRESFTDYCVLSGLSLYVDTTCKVTKFKWNLWLKLRREKTGIPEAKNGQDYWAILNK